MVDEKLEQESMVEEFWRSFLVDGPPRAKILRIKFFKSLTAEARCKFCFAPFDGFSSNFVKSVLKVYQSQFNPFYCNTCDDFAKKYQGGAEIPVTMLFADIRGSTALAEKIGPKEYSKLINRFYITSTHVLGHAGAMIEKLVGDEVVALFSQGLSGENYYGQAIKAAKDLLRETGHDDEGGPWVELGIGIHSGTTFVGSVGVPEGIMEVTSLGDVPNTASRLTSLAAPGEIYVSEDTMLAAKMDLEGIKKKTLALKGRNKKIGAYILNL